MSKEYDGPPLEECYKDDPELLAFYKKKLLVRGWGGSLSPMEKDYLRRMNPPWYAQIREAGKASRVGKKKAA